MRITIDVEDGVIKYLIKEVLKEAAMQRVAGLPSTCSQMVACTVCEGLAERSDVEITRMLI